MAAVILYNKLSLDLDIEKIDRDFFVYKITKETGYFERSIFDSPIIDLKARTVVYEWGNSFYVLFDKNKVSEQNIRSVLEEQDPELRIKRLCFDELCVVPKHVLAQLIFNTLNSCQDVDGRLLFNNISGGLFYMVEKKQSSIVMLQIKLTPDMLLKLDIATFSKLGEYDGESDALKKRLESAPRYRYIHDYGCMIGISRKALFPKAESYIRRNFSVQKNNKAFLDFNRFQSEKYGRSKVGVFCKFMTEAEKHLREYIHNIRLEALPEYNEFLPDEQGITLDWSQAQRNSINFVNLLSKKRSATMKKVEELVREQYGISVTRGPFKKDAFNVIFIHEVDYYEDKKKVDRQTSTCGKDPHQMVYPGVVQHATLENFLQINDEKQLRLATKKVIQDLLVKNDVYQKRLSLVHWESEYPWTFVMAEEKEDSKIRQYYKMTIHPTKEMTFESFASLDLVPYGSENQRIHSVYCDFERKRGGWYRVEGLFYREDGSDNIYALSKTDAYTMPLYKELDRMMKATALTYELSKEAIALELDDFLCQCKGTIKEEDISLLKSNLEKNSGEIITIGALLQGISARSKFIQAFNKHLIKNGRTPLTPDFKVGENKERYFGGFVGLKYYMQDAGLHYFVGTKSEKDIQTSFPRRCVIRRLDSTSGDIPAELVQEFFRCLTVDFIRENQYTVLPFQFKYLREYVKTLKISESNAKIRNSKGSESTN